MNKKDYSILVSVELAKRDDGSEFYRVKEDTPKEIADFLRDVVFSIDEECHDLDLTYKIVSDVCYSLSDIELADLVKEDFDAYDTVGEFASVYTSERLSYLNIWNQQEVSDRMKEGFEDIATACAVWYDEQVRRGVELVRDELMK